MYIRVLNYHAIVFVVIWSFLVLLPYGNANILDASKDSEKISSIVSGNIVHLSSGRHIRLAGVLAPEMVLASLSERLLEESKNQLAYYENKRIVPVRTTEKTDRYGRDTAEIYMVDNTARKPIHLQKELLLGGWAIAYPDHVSSQNFKDFLSFEREARKKKRGIWAQQDILLSSAAVEKSPKEYKYSFRIIEGTVRAATEKKKYIYVNFGDDWKTDFTLRFDKKAQKRMRNAEILNLLGKKLQVRGWLDEYYGPMMDISYIEQIEVLDDIIR